LKKIKLGVLGTRGLTNKYGGNETFIDYLVHGLDTDLFDIYVYAETHSKEKRIVQVNNNIYTIEIPFRKMAGPLKRAWFDVDNMLDSINWGMDIALLIGVGAGISVKSFYPQLRISKTKLVLHPDGLEWRRSRFPFYAKAMILGWYRKMLNIADDVVIDSQVLEGYLRDMGYSKRLHFIPYGAEIVSDDVRLPDLEERFNIKPGEYYMVVSRMVPENHILEIAKGFLRSDTNKKLILVANNTGDSYQRKVEGICKKSDRVILTGPIYDRKLLQGLRKGAFAYIHGHSVGGTNPSLLEAMAAGNAVIAFDVPFNREAAEGAAVFFDGIDSLASCINNLDRDKEQYERMKLNAVNIISQRYTWDSVVKKYKDLFLSLVGDRGDV
jgi:rhamnosyltransferase